MIYNSVSDYQNLAIILHLSWHISTINIWQYYILIHSQLTHQEHTLDGHKRLRDNSTCPLIAERISNNNSEYQDTSSDNHRNYVHQSRRKRSIRLLEYHRLHQITTSQVPVNRGYMCVNFMSLNSMIFFQYWHIIFSIYIRL